MSGVLGALVWNKTVTLTNAQIKTLPTIPVEVVPAPGVGKILLIQGAFLSITSQGAYSNIDTSDTYITVSYQSDVIELASYVVNSGGSNRLTIFFDGTNRIAQLFPSGISVVSGLGFAVLAVTTSNVANKNLEVMVYNAAAGNFTGGNAANTLTVTVFYNMIEL